MVPPDRSRRSFLKTSAALAGTMPLIDGLLQAQSGKASRPLLAYVGTFSSPLRDVLPTQVDRPPGNGRGIHLFQVNRTTGAMTPAGIHEMGTSPSCLALNSSGTRMYSANETDRVGENKEGTVSAFAINRADGKLELLNTVRSIDGEGTDRAFLVFAHPIRFIGGIHPGSGGIQSQAARARAHRVDASGRHCPGGAIHLKEVNAAPITGRQIHLGWQHIAERRTEGSDIGEEWSGCFSRLRLEQPIDEGCCPCKCD